MIHIYDETGRITQSTVQSAPGYTDMLTAQGLRFYEVGQTGQDTYMDLTVPDRPLPKSRPILGVAPSTMTPKPMESVTVADVPACRMQVTGPLGLFVIDHPGGPMTLKFQAAGQYEVSFEAFPYRAVHWRFAVAAPTAGDAS